MLGKNRCIGDLSANPDLSELTEALSRTRRIISSVRLEDLSQFVANGANSGSNSDEVSGSV